MQQWQLQEAKARLSEVVKNASTMGPQEITVRGEPTVVVISKADFEALQKRKPSFVELMRQSPLFDIELDLERDRSLDRDISL